MIKLIATDIDGTLLRDGTLMLDPEYMTVIEKLIAKGIRFVACSGRQFISERKLFAPIRDKLLYITDGGTVVRTPKEILKVHTLPEEIWHGMCDRTINRRIKINAVRISPVLIRTVIEYLYILQMDISGTINPRIPKGRITKHNTIN